MITYSAGSLPASNLWARTRGAGIGEVEVHSGKSRLASRMESSLMFRFFFFFLIRPRVRVGCFGRFSFVWFFVFEVYFGYLAGVRTEFIL